MAADIAVFSQDAADFDPERGSILAVVEDCDGQGAIGSRVVLKEAEGAPILYAGGPSLCRFDTPEETVTRCGRAFVTDLAPGRYTVGLEHGESSFDGPTVYVEAGSIMTLRLEPR